MLRKVQWSISVAVCIYGIALFGGLGVTAVLFIGIGILYCGVAAVATRGTIIPVLLSLLADGFLGFWLWTLLTGSLKAVPLNTNLQGRRPEIEDYISLDVVASALILVLVVVYFAMALYSWKKISSKGWV